MVLGMWTSVRSPLGRWSRRLAGLVLAGLVLSGCSAGPAGTPRVVDPADPYAAEYEQAMDGASDFIKQVLADHHISDAELAEAQDHLVACLREQGEKPFVSTENGRREVHVPAEADSACSDEWMGTIQERYLTERINPRNDDMNDLVVACMKRLGVVPPEFTGRDLAELAEKAIGSYSVAVDDEGNETRFGEELPEDPDPKLPSGMSITAPETQGCWADPLGTGSGEG